jgi:hypothetical protein
MSIYPIQTLSRALLSLLGLLLSLRVGSSAG